jgi:hypothetical protein
MLSPRSLEGTAEGTKKADAAGPATEGVDVRTWEKEMELARYNEHVRRQIQACLEPIEEHQLAIDMYKGRIREHEAKITACRERAGNHEAALDSRMVLPGVFQSDASRWAKPLTSIVQNDTALVWLMLRSEEPLPLPLQKMLWMDPNCRFRGDRDILLASLEKGLDDNHVRIKWGHDLASDRRLVLKCFEECPACIDFSDASDLPESYLKDGKMLRAFLSSKSRGCRPPFSKTLFNDPTVMATS